MECFGCIIKYILCCLNDKCFQDIFIYMAEKVAQSTDNTVDDAIVAEIKRRLEESRKST